MKSNLARTFVAASLALALMSASGLPAQATPLQQTDSAPAGVAALTGGGPWTWPAGMGLDTYVRALAWDGAILYVGGDFFNGGDSVGGNDDDCDHIAIWTGSTWDCPAAISLNGTVNALAYDGTNLYAGGYFTDAGGDDDCDYIAIWTGSAWDCPAGMALGDAVNALVKRGLNLYAGGEFINAGGEVDCDYIGVWTGAAWDCVGGMGLSTNVFALAHDGTYLYAGGNFINAGADGDCDRIGIWTGLGWSCPAGMALVQAVFAFALDGNNLYAGGPFTDAGGDLDCDYIGIWTGAAWDCSAAMPLSSYILSLLWDGTSLYAGGNFTDAGGDGDCDYIGVWTGAAWDCPAGMALVSGVLTLEHDGANLYAGGAFEDAGGDTDADRVAMFPLPWLFKDGFESGNFSAWSGFNTGSGNMTVGAGCALEGSFGLCLPSTNDKRKQMIDQVPADEKFYYGQFMLDPNGITIGGDSDRVRIFTGRNDATFPFIVLLRYNAGAYQIRLRVQNDAANYTDSSWFTITDAVHTIQVEWKADTSDGAGDGYGALYIDGVFQQRLGGVDNDTLRVDKILLGITSRMDGMVFTGTMYMDAFHSDNNGFPE